MTGKLYTLSQGETLIVYPNETEMTTHLIEIQPAVEVTKKKWYQKLWQEEINKKQLLSAFQKSIASLNTEETKTFQSHLQNLYDYFKNQFNTLSESDFKKSIFPALISDFTQLTEKIKKSGNDKATLYSDIQEFADKLDVTANKYEQKKPMNACLRLLIAQVVGAAVGFVVGAIAFGALTAYAGGFGAIPGAIIGGIKGFMIATGCFAAAGAFIATPDSFNASHRSTFFYSLNNKALTKAKQTATDLKQAVEVMPVNSPLNRTL